MEQTAPVVSVTESLATPYILPGVMKEFQEGSKVIERERHVSFGYVFYSSSGTGGNGGTIGAAGTQIAQAQVQQGVSTFNLGIKPKCPPFFHGRANEDVMTWVAKVSDFFYLTEATNRQQVAYATTLLLEAAAG